MCLLKAPAIFSNFRNIEIAFLFLIALKLTFNSVALFKDYNADSAAFIFSLPKNVFAQSNSPIPEEAKPSPINMEILDTINKRNLELDTKEAALDQKEQELNMLQANIDEKLRKMDEVQKKIESLLTAREDLIERSLKHLVKVYSAMKPTAAANLIEKLDKDISLQILAKMKGKNAAKILGKMDPAIATDLSDKIAKRK